MTNRQKGLVLGVMLVAVTAVLGEAAMRVLQYFQSGVSPTTFLPGYRQSRFVLSPFLVFGPRIDWPIPDRPNPETAYFNEQGFRTREHVGPKPADQIRLIALGGSTTEDIWNEDGLHWPLWTERNLQNDGLNIRVLNSGMSAYTTAHTLVRMAFDVLDYEPDAVVVMHNVNDLTANYRAAIANVPVDGHYRMPFAQKAFTNDLEESDIVFVRLINSIRARLRGQPEYIVPEEYDISRGLGYFKRNLSSLHALASARGTRLVLLTMPLCLSETVYRRVQQNGRLGVSPPMPESFERFQQDMAAYNDAVREVGAAESIAVIDMNVLLGGDERWFADVVHYNAAGSRRFGELLAVELTPLIPGLRTQKADQSTN